MKYTNLPIKDMTLKAIKKIDDDELYFLTEDFRVFRMYHGQDCCEMVTIDDINGDLEDLVGSPLVMAEVATKDVPNKEKRDESDLWTFYRFRTIKGDVNIKWWGSSNGWYSVEVDFEELKNDPDDWDDYSPYLETLSSYFMDYIPEFLIEQVNTYIQQQ